MATAKAYPVIGSFGINMERIIHTCLVPAKEILLLRDFLFYSQFSSFLLASPSPSEVNRGCVTMPLAILGTIRVFRNAVTIDLVPR